jgi:CheY-like chemotaxis protein
MKSILLCSSNPLLIKSLYATLRDEGHAVDDVEHPALAVQRVLERPYDLMIVDAEPFGLSAGDAARIVTAIAPEMAIFCVGPQPGSGHPPAVPLPADPDAIRELIRHVATRRPQETPAEGRWA